jgi:hypothetical protein
VRGWGLTLERFGGHTTTMGPPLPWQLLVRKKMMEIDLMILLELKFVFPAF